MFDRAILHLDLDAFFVSVELLRHPELRGKPPPPANRICSANSTISVSGSEQARW